MSVTIGLTGGIASGKSTVSSMFREMGIPVVDADVIARLVVEPGQETYNEIVQSFGEGILYQDRTINREALGSIVFHNDDKRKVLNNIVHPAVRKRMLEEKEQFITSGCSAVVLDIPLLFESGLSYMVDKTIVVYVNYENQLNRLMNRNQLSKTEALTRMQSQMPLEEKKALADEVIDNNGTIQESKLQLQKILHKWSLI
jgi:dephospho-CoA kinase